MSYQKQKNFKTCMCKITLLQTFDVKQSTIKISKQKLYFSLKT